MSRASLAKDPRDVAAMFDDVAEKYDVTNDVLSLGQDRLWRRAVLRAVDADRATRSSTSRPARARAVNPSSTRAPTWSPPTSAWACSAWAKRRDDLGFTAADAMRLPFADNSFDAVTMSFGLRNVADVDDALGSSRASLSPRWPPGHL